MPGRVAILLLLPMLLATGSRAQTAPAATPADPKQEQHDTTTPKGALKALAAALRDGNAERIRQVMDAANPAETRMVAAMAEMARAMADLQKAAVKAFGAEGAKEIVGDTQATDAQGRARIDAADVRIQGDTATVVVAEGEDAPVVMRRVGGHWRVPMAELSKNADPSVLDERLAELAEQRKLVVELTKEIGEGQFNSPAQAKDAWQSRAMQAVTRRPPARKPQAEPNRPQPESAVPTGNAPARPASGK
jgi:hypothetical protein